MSNIIRFGPSGNGDAFYEAGYKLSVDAPMWLNAIGLNAYEYSFGRGFTMGFDRATELGEKAKLCGVLVSVHAPFYINLANEDDEMIEHSFSYILNSFKYLECFGGKHVVVHIGSIGKSERVDAIKRIKSNLKKCVEMLKLNGFQDKFLCLETMGKYSQIGSYQEIIDLCSIDDMLLPCFDFGHINCVMQGELKTQKDYEKIFNLAIEKLGFDRINNCHIHFSKIMYSAKGEIKHLDFNDNLYGPEFEPLAKAILSLKLHPHIICESATKMSEDALTMKNIYQRNK